MGVKFVETGEHQYQEKNAADSDFYSSRGTWNSKYFHTKILRDTPNKMNT